MTKKCQLLWAKGNKNINVYLGKISGNQPRPLEFSATDGISFTVRPIGQLANPDANPTLFILINSTTPLGKVDCIPSAQTSS